MVNITELQTLIQDGEFWKNKNILTIMGLAGSGISTVVRDLSEKKAEEASHVNYVYLDLYDIGALSEFKALRHVAYELREKLIIAGIIRDKEFEIDEDDYYKLHFSIINFLKKLKLKTSVIIVFDNFENVLGLKNYFFESLREIALTKLAGVEKSLKFVIIGDAFLDDEKYIETFGKLYPLLYENVLFVSGFEIKNIAEVLDGIASDKNKIATQIFNLSAGNPKLVDRLLDYYARKVQTDKGFVFDDARQIVIDDKEIAFTLFRIWKGLSDKQKNILSKIYAQSLFKLNPSVLSNSFLLETGLIIKMADNKYELGLSLLEVTLSTAEITVSEEQTISSPASNKEAEVSEDDDMSGLLSGNAADAARVAQTVSSGGSTYKGNVQAQEMSDDDASGMLTGNAAEAAKTASNYQSTQKVVTKPTVLTQQKSATPAEDLDTDKLSSQEFKVFNHFKKNNGKLVSKDEIAKLMWGKKQRTKKEDWAIDQLIKRLRDKIGDSKGLKLQTVRGRGYRYLA